MKKTSKALQQQQQAIERDYKLFKQLNGEKSWPFDAFYSGFSYGIKFQRQEVKNRTKQGETKKKK